MDMMEHKGNVLIPVIAYGDAAGLPVETRSAEYIAETYGKIQSLLPTNENPLFANESEPGIWSDDTQLTIAVARALIKAGEFNIETMVESHISAYDSTPEIFRKGRMIKRGWGGSTIDAMEKLKLGISPAESGTVDGSGNGVLMKITPLAYWQAAQDTPDDVRYEQYDALTNMTHNSAISRLTTRVHGDMLKYLIENGYEKNGFINELFGSVSQHEITTQSGNDTSQLLSYLSSMENRNDILVRTDAKGFYAPQTLAMAYGAFILNDGKFTESVYEAVNLGGDTDSTASIAAGMSAFASREIVRVPVDHQQLDQLQLLKKTSRQLAQKALGSVKTAR